jgi:hypothetical protein
MRERELAAFKLCGFEHEETQTGGFHAFFLRKPSCNACSTRSIRLLDYDSSKAFRGAIRLLRIHEADQEVAQHACKSCALPPTANWLRVHTYKHDRILTHVYVHVHTYTHILTCTRTHTSRTISDSKARAHVTQTLRAERALSDTGVAAVSISNEQHAKCGVQRFECVSGGCRNLTQSDVDQTLPVDGAVNAQAAVDSLSETGRTGQ